MENITTKIISIAIFICIVFYIIIIDKHKIKLIMEALKKKHILFNLTLIFIFYIIINFIINNKKLNLINIDKDEHKILIKSCNLGIFGLIIAIFSHLDLIIAPFWLIFIASAIFNFEM